VNCGAQRNRCDKSKPTDIGKPGKAADATTFNRFGLGGGPAAFISGYQVKEANILYSTEGS